MRTHRLVLLPIAIVLFFATTASFDVSVPFVLLCLLSWPAIVYLALRWGQDVDGSDAEWVWRYGTSSRFRSPTRSR